MPEIAPVPFGPDLCALCVLCGEVKSRDSAERFPPKEYRGGGSAFNLRGFLSSGPQKQRTPIKHSDSFRLSLEKPPKLLRSLASFLS